MPDVKNKHTAKLPDGGAVFGFNPKSGGGVVIVSALDEGGFELLDLSSGQREKVALGDDLVVFAAIELNGGA
jgi:hypothetical protein